MASAPLGVASRLTAPNSSPTTGHPIAARLLLAVLLLMLAGPALLPVADLLRTPAAWGAWAEAGRVAGLAANTAALAALATLVAVPVGAVGAVLLGRVAVPGRAALRGLVLAGLAVPLPVVAVGWQVVLGAWLPPLTLEPGAVVWRPWAQGLLPAAWVHAAAGLPWVVWVVGAGLRHTDPGLEDDARLLGGAGAVARWVLLPRAAVAGLAAAGWVAVQAATEVPVTDAMMVRTFAEEVYTQFVGAAAGLAAAVAVTVPAWLLSAAVAGAAARRVVRLYGEPPADAGRPADLPVGRAARLLAGAGLWAAALLFAGLPLAALAWKAGGGGTPVGWHPGSLTAELLKVARTDGRVLLGSLLAAGAAGVVAVGLAWPACRLAGGSRPFARFLFGLAVLLWVTPGPLVGLGLKAAVAGLLDAEDWALARVGLTLPFPPLRSLLYSQPSPVPAAWAAVVRYFPVAVAVLWPAVRAVPRDLDDAARLDGLGPLGMWRHLMAPLTGGAAGRAVLGVAALALGEVSAGKLVAPPGAPAYILSLFDQMHYGADSTVAALALLQVAATVAVGGVLLWSFAAPSRP